MDFNNNGLDDFLEFEMFNDDSDDYCFKRKIFPQEDNIPVWQKIWALYCLYLRCV